MAAILSSISGKLVLVAGSAIALVVTAYTAYTGWDAKIRTEAQVMTLATEKAAMVSQKVSAQITEAVSAGTTLAASISGYIEKGSRNRSDIIALTETIGPRYKNLFGAWMCEIPGVQSSKPLMGTEGLNDAGVFTAYWTKAANGAMEFSTWNIKPEDEYFAGPLKSGASVVTEPYLASIGALITSVSVPVKVDGKLVGLAGVDIKLDDLVSSLAALKPFEGGNTMLLASNGKWLAHPDKNQLMKVYSDTGAAEVKAALADGKMRVLRGFEDGRVRLIYPLTTTGMNVTWAAVLDVPANIFSTPVIEAIENAIASGLVILIVALGIIYAASTALVRRPLAGVLSVVNRLTNGDYNTGVEHAGRKDEVGTLARALEQFRHELNNGVAARQEQEKLQRTMASEREQQMAIDSAKADDLRHFVHQVQAGFDALAKGDLTVRMQVGVAPEFEAIRQNFNTSVASLEEAVGGVITTVATIRSGLGEISSASNDLARRTEQQAASLEETIAALAEVSRGVNRTAEGASNAQGIVGVARNNAEKGGNIVGRAIEAMSAIQGSSEKIGNIIGVIDEIAFQTNLLALNAGVEAARAGEAGKGFAVVAQEVRELAQRSAQAAKEIKELISTSSAQVQSGVDLVKASGASLAEIVGQVVSMSDTMDAIANAAREQATSLREVTEAGDNMDKVTQQNAAMVEETTAAAQNLSHETDTLATMVQRFKTKANSGAQGYGSRYAMAS
ncbi:methyl-accepting chemotaxis protein [Rhizobium oryzicola]|uniref:Methyl-accepting chemotaxis protein n=1 Tax=Rhizobium oryzicola TaxID=1232668 RepID=A0ABT8SS33_9HYPH|nr:methyl-accepting chemotaxis protein [Rhizobium oryzicola]MDO1580688.1 methyl-accepting chemotaxis protein [Rhizobium oryzicola]